MSASDLLPDYTTVTPADVTEITDAAIEQSDRLVAALVGDRDDRTYANTMQPLDDLTVIMNDADGRGVFMARVHPNAEVRKAAVAAEETMAKWGNDLVMRPDVAAAIKGYAETVDAANLDGLQARNLEFWLRDLRRAGHDLGGADRDELRKLRQRLIEVQVAYRSNLDEWDDGIDMTLEDLAGLPESYIERLAPGSEPDTYRVSMAYPDYIPFVEEAERRDLRQRLQFKFWNRAVEANMPLLEEAIERLVADRVCTFLSNDAEIFEAIQGWNHEVAELKRLVERAAKLSKAWTTHSPARTRSILRALIVRIDVQATKVDIHLVAARLPDLLRGNPLDPSLASERAEDPDRM
ncbi:MAG: hypothetical protein IIA44_08390, partial [Acidobacteria bacterium]|nr:hypothetical protein [Acidobacteriota bacterium]